jgi:hypothetical protein
MEAISKRLQGERGTSKTLRLFRFGPNKASPGSMFSATIKI